MATLGACVANDSDDDEPAPPPVTADYGDAPDGRLQPDGTFDDEGYPTLFGAGGAHALDTTAVALADAPVNATVSAELDADDLSDPDGEPNFIRFAQPQPDDENRDDFDNGIISAALNLADRDNPLLDVVVGTALQQDAAAGVYYVNVLFDHNVDGAWNGAEPGFDPTSPPQQTTAADLNDEWIVVNAEVELTAATPTRQVAFSIPLAGALFSARRATGLLGPYMRIALTSEPVTDSVWKGEGAFARGEIEDWLLAGFDDPPHFTCEDEFGLGAAVFDFAGNAQIALPCLLARPDFSSDATSIDFAYQFSQLLPAGAPDVQITCPPNPTPGVAHADPGQATFAAPLPLPCTAQAIGNVAARLPVFAVDIQTDLDGGVFVTRGFDSSVAIELSEVREYLLFTDTNDDPTDDVLEVCIGVSGSHNTGNGGQIIQLTTDKGDCSMLPNDGVTDGTFIVSGGEGLAGRTEMFLSVLGGGSAFMGSGNVTSLLFNGEPVAGGIWNVPIDRDSSNTLEVEFTSGLAFEIQIDIAFSPDEFNTVTQTITNGICRER